MQSIDQFNGFDDDLADWGPIRMIFLQYASDPIVVFSFGSALRRPDWYQEKRAADVSPDLVWVPIVTMLQTALDMTIAVQVKGFGHNYAPLDYVRGWHELLAVEDWSPEQTANLVAFMEARLGT